MKKSTLITIAVIIVLAIGGTILKTTVFAKEEPKEHKTLKQEYQELKAEHAWYEYDLLETKQKERFLEEKEQQAREKAKSFVEVINWTWQGFQK